jgi:hypothetical protein
MGQLWKSPKKQTKKELQICDYLKTAGKLFKFLREHRHLIFDESLCRMMDSMYHDQPRGKKMVSPSILGMATILQAYEQKSDADAVRASVFDKCWQMTLGCLNKDEPPFSQGTLQDFRCRMIKHDMDKALNAKVVEIAKDFGGFCFKKLRVALDSAPLQGLGRVEDTINLLGNALELLVGSIATVSEIPEAKIRHEAGTEIIGKSSIKAAIDIDWSDKAQKEGALQLLLEDVKKVMSWLKNKDEWILASVEVDQSLALLRKRLKQDLERDPNGGAKIKKGVAKDRQISIVDPQMRHGRKSSSRTINGFKQHIAIEMDSKLILATSMRPANEPEFAATEYLKPDVIAWGEVDEYQIDRGYLASVWTTSLYEAGKLVVCKPWTPANSGLLTKKAFTIDLVHNQVTCPGKMTADISTGKKKMARFAVSDCNVCALKSHCTTSKTGRTINIHEQEGMLQKLEKYQSTHEGRAAARERVKVEHCLAAICNRNGHKARYIGCRKNEFNLNRAAIIHNLHIGLQLCS